MRDADKGLAALAKALAVLCVRNTFLEDLHSGITPSSKSGDYADVSVVTPYGEIPWNKLSRISDAEMKRLLKEVVNNIYTFLCRREEKGFLEPFVLFGNKMAAGWDEPELAKDFVVPSEPTLTGDGHMPIDRPQRQRGQRKKKKAGAPERGK